MTPVQERVFKFARVSCAVLSCLLAAGPIFGFAALKPVLVGEGVYAEDCKPREVEQGVFICSRQDEKLNFMFTVAAVAASVGTILVSTVLDKFGPRTCAFSGSAILAAGSWFMSQAHTFDNLDGYVLGYLLMGLAGTFVLLSTFNLSNLFPQNSGLILALLTGACDASSGLFLFYRFEYFKGNGVSIQRFFNWYLMVPVFIFATTLFMSPSHSEAKTMGGIARISEQRTGNDEPTEQTSLLETDFTSSINGQVPLNRRPRGARRQTTLNDVFKDPTESSGVWGALHHLHASQQLTSPWFVLIVMFTAMQMIHINYYIESVFGQYQYMLKDDISAHQVTEYFDIALPVGGIVAIPFVGILVDNLSTLSVFSIITGASVVVSALGLVPSYHVGVLRASILVLYRPLYFTAISDYSAKVFGFDTFGLVYGLILSISGLGNWLMVYFDFITHRMFHKNPVPVNIIMTVATGAIGVAIVMFIWTQSKHIRRKQLEDEARHAPTSTMPGGGGGSGSGHTNECRSGECEDCVCEV